MKFGQGLPPADGWKRDMPEPKDEHTHGPFAGPYSSCPACSAATKREPLLKWLRSPCDAPNWLFMALSLLLIIVSLFSLMGVGK